MSTALLTRRKSSSISSSPTNSSVSSSDDSNNGVNNDRKPPSLLSLSVEEQRHQKHTSSSSSTSSSMTLPTSTTSSSSSSSSLLSTLLSPFNIIMDISTSAPPPAASASLSRRCSTAGAQVDNIVTSSLRTTTMTTSKVVAEECSSDDGSVSAEDDEEDEAEDEDDDDVRLLVSDTVDEENVSSSSNSSSNQQQSSSSSSSSSQLVVVVDKPGFRKRLALIRTRRPRLPRVKEVDVQAYMSKREMTVTQEKWNAITVIPNPIFCFYYLLAGLWVSNDLVQQARMEYNNNNNGHDFFSSMDTTGGDFGGYLNNMLGDEHGCLNNPTAVSSSLSWWNWWLSTMPALPPLPAMAVALGITLHAPWSVLYHWKYAHALPAGAPRTNHWSRRMDQSMIHVASAIIAYGTSGSYNYFMANFIYNADCVYRQLHESKVRPRRNKVRLLISVIAYTLPIVWYEGHDNWFLFGQLWIVLLVGFWLFGLYPIGGWSHCVFHLVAMLLPPLLMQAACRLPMAQEQMKLAAQCVVFAEQHAAAAAVAAQ